MATSKKSIKAPSPAIATTPKTPLPNIGKGKGPVKVKATEPDKTQEPSIAQPPAQTPFSPASVQVGKASGGGQLMDVQDVAINSITRYPGNPRRNAHAVPSIMASLKEFGWQQPIVVDLKGVIIVGDTRYQAAQALGYKTVPVQIAKHLSPAQVTAYRVADNRVGEISQWNEAKLFSELQLIANEKFDLKGMGFTDEELGLVDEKAKEDNRFLEDFEVMPEPKPKWILIRAPEDRAVEIVSMLKNMKLKDVKLEYSGDDGLDEHNKSLKD